MFSRCAVSRFSGTVNSKLVRFREKARLQGAGQRRPDAGFLFIGGIWQEIDGQQAARSGDPSVRSELDRLYPACLIECMPAALADHPRDAASTASIRTANKRLVGKDACIRDAHDRMEGHGNLHIKPIAVPAATAHGLDVRDPLRRQSPGTLIQNGRSGSPQTACVVPRRVAAPTGRYRRGRPCFSLSGLRARTAPP